MSATRRPSQDAGQDPGRTSVYEMLGLMRGILADGVVNEAEARAVARWLESHPGADRLWPASAVARRIRRIFEDGIVDTDERDDLASLFHELISEHESATRGASRLPVDDPPPALRFKGNVYVFVGRFAYGPLGACHRAVVRLGGVAEATVTERTDYLVVGAFGRQGSGGETWNDKVQAALGLRADGGRPAIVAESHWAAGLP